MPLDTPTQVAPLPGYSLLAVGYASGAVLVYSTFSMPPRARFLISKNGPHLAANKVSGGRVAGANTITSDAADVAGGLALVLQWDPAGPVVGLQWGVDGKVLLVVREGGQVQLCQMRPADFGQVRGDGYQKVGVVAVGWWV